MVIGAVVVNQAINQAAKTIVSYSEGGENNPFYYSASSNKPVGNNDDEEEAETANDVTTIRTSSHKRRGALRRKRRDGVIVPPESFRFRQRLQSDVGGSCTGSEQNDYECKTCCCLESTKKIVDCSSFVADFRKRVSEQYSDAYPEEDAASIKRRLTRFFEMNRVCQINPAERNRFCNDAVVATKMASKKKKQPGFCEGEDEGEEEESSKEEEKIRYGLMSFKCDALFGSKYSVHSVTHDPAAKLLRLCKADSKKKKKDPDCRNILLGDSYHPTKEKSKNGKIENKIKLFDPKKKKNCYLRYDDEATCKKFKTKSDTPSSSCVNRAEFILFGKKIGVLGW